MLERRHRIYGSCVSLVVLFAVLYPLTFDRNRDSFPLSNYPMFARGRHNARLVMEYMVADTPERGSHPVPPRLIANGEVLQAKVALWRVSRTGPEERELFCREVAARVAEEEGGPLARATRLRFLRGDHDAVSFLSEGRRGPEVVLAQCEVTR